MKKKVIIIDYGVGNLKSVFNALKKIDCLPQIASTSHQFQDASHIILPGVGAFKNAMDEIKRLEILDSLYASVKRGVNLLGICLGMQMLFENSNENGFHQGLSFIEGFVDKIPSNKNDNFINKIPHIGWNKVNLNISNESNSLFKSFSANQYFYFVHSYHVNPLNDKHILATTNYNNLKIVAAIKKKKCNWSTIPS